MSAVTLFSFYIDLLLARKKWLLYFEMHFLRLTKKKMALSYNKLVIVQTECFQDRAALFPMDVKIS